MTAPDFEAIARDLADIHPWSWSQEGIDDRCMFCGSTVREYSTGHHEHHHRPTCQWFAARQALGMDVERHYNDGPTDRDDDVDWEPSA